MASSSSSSSSKSESFDVFLSFRGVDTRRTFVSHLENALKSKAINTFKDDKKLQAGDRISDELIRAIENSKFAVVVISKNYASSGWCLDELEKIIECQEKGMLTIFPIFYEVDPSDVRYQKGTFADAFEKHNVRQSPHKVQEWRNALKKVASLSGKDSRNSPDDAALVSEIVEDIFQRLISMEPKDFDGIIGMDAHLKELDPLLNIGSIDEVRMIGIWGMGGVGKTTIADYLYRMYKHQFQFHCFIRNIKKIYSEEGLEKLLRLCLSRILKDEKFMLETTEIDSNMIKSRLRGQKVLAVLDDVDDLDQLEALAKHTTWFGLGSRIIVTTRESDLFIKHRIELVYKVRCLNDHVALRLFNHIAFEGKQVSDDFTELSKRVLELVKGLPLAIKVLGKALRGRKLREWKAIIDKLEKAPDKSIMDCLKVSYVGLDDREKDIFLTIACLFSGEYVSHLLQLLDDEDCKVHRSVANEDCEVNTSLNTLAEKALIDISKEKAFIYIFEDRRVTMHDLIQDMGKDIVRQQSNGEPWKQRFLWDHKDIYDVLANGKEAEAIEGISLDMSKIKRFPMRSKSFENMPNLKFLVIRNTSNYKGDMSQLCDAINHLPPGLKLLDWDNFPLTTLPPTFEAECLVDLRLPHSHLEKLSVKDLYLGKLRRLEFQSCLHLKEVPKLPRNIVEINFSGTNIRRIPEIPNLPTIKILNMSECRKLLEIPNMIGGLTSLQTLNLRDCRSLLEIPNSIGDLTALGRLNLSSCGKLTSIPDTIGGLTSLRTLSLRFCRSLLEIPSSIGDLTALGQLDLSSCGKLTMIPDTIAGLTSLQILNLWFCNSLLEIPSSVGDLTALGQLDLSSCGKLTSIPNTIGGLTSLQTLNLRDCRSLLEIPSSIGDLTALGELDLSSCGKLTSIPNTIGGLTSLQTLNLRNCRSLLEIPSSIGNLTALRRLDLSSCRKLMSIPDTIGGLTSLQTLELWFCNSLLEFPSSIGDLTGLEQLDLSSCGKLTSIPNTIRGLTSLQTLNLQNCMSLLEIPSSIGDLTALGQLNLSSCGKLTSLPNTIGDLTSLQTLNLQSCKSLLEIPSSIGNLAALGRLDLSCCGSLMSIPDTIGDLAALRSLLFCGKLTSIPDTIGSLIGLEHLNVGSYGRLLEIPSTIGNLTMIKELYISNCQSVRSIPDVMGNLTTLRRLSLIDCFKLESIPSTIRNLTSLECLNIRGCQMLMEIPNIIGDLKALKCLQLKDCNKLVHLPETIGNLTTLEELDLSGTTFLDIPSSIGNLRTLKRLTIESYEKLWNILETIMSLTALEYLQLSGCTMLSEIPSSIGNLGALQFLSIKNCEKLWNIPETIGNLTALEDLDLSGWTTLLEIPSSIGNLRALKRLTIANCEKLWNIPETIGNVTALEDLNLSDCTTLLEIPSSIGNLRALERLTIVNCEKLRNIPETIGNLIALERLNLWGCRALSEIPSSIGNLRALQFLSIVNCGKLRNIPETIGNLTALGHLSLSGCTALLDIPSSIGNLRALKRLTIANCEKLWNIPKTIGNVTALEDLNLSNWTTLSEIPSSIGNLRALERLTIVSCEKLWNIPETIGNLTGLEHLSLLGCTTLSEIPSSIGNLRALQFLSIVNCENLWNIPETIGNLTALGYLNLAGCTKLSEIPSSIGNLRTLNHLSLSNCENLGSILKIIGNISNLQLLNLSGCNICSDISSIISNMTRLQHLSPPEDIDCIWKIIEERPSRNLFSKCYGFGPDVVEARWEKSPGNQAIEVLYLFRDRYDPKYVPCRCTKFSIFHDLRELSLRNLNLWEIPDDFGHLQSLQRLDLSGNDFEIISASIKQFLQLRLLVLSHCRKIRSIPELSSGLKYLYANDCSSLESISNVSSHPFHELMLSDCFKLGEDPWEFIQHMIFSMPSSKGEIETKACFSASELPACISHQSAEQRLTIRCSEVDSGSKPMGFVAGVVVACGNLKELHQKRCEKQKYLGLTESFCDISHLNIQCRWHGEGYQSKHISFDLEKLPRHVSVTTSGSDLLFVFSCNFGEEKSCDVISFQFDFEWKTETERFTLFSIEELQQIHAMKRCGIRLCFSEETQHAQSVLPLTSGIHMPDIDELVEEGNCSNLTSSDQSEHGEDLNNDEETLAPSSKRPKYYHSY